jgi:hypothetical protein
MDPVLSTIFPTYNIGSDGFNWFIGQVENVIDIKNSGRVQVRIVGVHHKKGTVTKTEDLPWANVMLPVNVPFGTGQPAGSNNLKVGAWVIGFYLDPDGQKPLIIGSIASTQASTFKDVQDILPGFDSLELSSKRVTGNTPSEAVNGAIHRSASEVKDGKNEKGASTEGGEPAVKKSAKSGGVPAALAALKGTNSDTNPTGGKVCVPLADANCDAKDIGSAIKRVLSELLAASQNSGGNLGDYYISKANGLLYSGVDIPREYITQITRLTNSFALRIKKEIFFGIRDAIEELVKLIIGVESAKQVAETAQDKPKNPKESYVPNTERGNFLQEVIDTFNKILNEVGCSFKKTIDDLINYLIDLILEYLQDAFTAANCLIDNIVNSAVSFIESGFTSLVESVLGPLQSLLGSAGSFLNIVGGVINRVLNILGISCTGPDQDCKKDKNICSDGSNGEDDEDEDDASFFDKLIEEIENGSLRGTDLSGDISQFTRGVCEDATKNSQTDTKAKLTGGVLNDSQTNTYVAVSEATPNIPLSVSEYPTSFPNTITTPDLKRDVSDNIDYFITAQEDQIKSGEIARFDIVGPERNGVLEIDYIEESYNIASEAGVVYPPCIISSEDGQAFGLEIEVSRGEFGEAYLRILNPGRRFLVGTSFILNGSKIGGEDGTNDIPFTISLVGELLDLKIFGDVFEKNLLDSERRYEEFSELLYTEPTTISYVTVKNTTVEMPSFLGVEILQKRAAASVTIWDEKPEDQFPEEKFNNKLVTITTEKDDYLEGETIEYIIESVGYEEGTIFTYELFGSISTNDYIDVTAGEVTVDADGNAKAFVFIKEDEEFERLESLTLLLLDGSIPLGSRTLFVADKEEEEEEDVFVLSQETTEQELLDYLNGLDLTTTTDFGNFVINLPPELAPLPKLTIPPEPAIDEYIPPELGAPIVDEDGSIISIPVSYPGNKSFQVPPKVTISGDGYGAAAIALLDDRGFVSEIRVTKIGIGYKPNLPADNDINCVIDSFTIIRPGFNYNTAPTIFVNGDSKVAEAIINEDGFISGVNVLNRSITYDTIPEIIVVGGEGIGGFVLPSLVCLPPTELEAKGYVKIGTGTYIDCP